MKFSILFTALMLVACGSDGKDGVAGRDGVDAGAIKELMVCEGATVNGIGPWVGGYMWYERARMEGGDVHVSFKLRDGAGAYYSMSAMYKAGMEGGKEGRIALATPHGLVQAYGQTEGIPFLGVEGGPYSNPDGCKVY